MTTEPLVKPQKSCRVCKAKDLILYFDFKEMPLANRNLSFSELNAGESKFPLQLLFSVNNDIGYVNDPYYSVGNPLANKLLYGNGFGLDIVAYYNKTARLEYTRNHLGEWGFYVRTSTGF